VEVLSQRVAAGSTVYHLSPQGHQCMAWYLLSLYAGSILTYHYSRFACYCQVFCL